jgi:hypothetical protein
MMNDQSMRVPESGQKHELRRFAGAADALAPFFGLQGPRVPDTKRPPALVPGRELEATPDRRYLSTLLGNRLTAGHKILVLVI